MIQLQIPRSQIWLPDIQLYNSASHEPQIESDITTIVMNNGLAIDVLPMMLRSTCKMDVTWFPFDEQKCLLEFGSWTFSTKYMRLELDGLAADTSWFVSVILRRV